MDDTRTRGGHRRFHRSLPRQIRGHVLRSDLGRGDLELVVTPARPDSGGRIRADWPLSTLTNNGRVAVVNATLVLDGSWLGGTVLNRPRNPLYPGLPHPV